MATDPFSIISDPVQSQSLVAYALAMPPVSGDDADVMSAFSSLPSQPWAWQGGQPTVVSGVLVAGSGTVTFTYTNDLTGSYPIVGCALVYNNPDPVVVYWDLSDTPYTMSTVNDYVPLTVTVIINDPGD